MADEHVFEIWHNPRCTKSRQTLSLLEKKGIHPVVVKYLDKPPTQKRIGEVLDMLGIEPRDLMRKKEAPYKELGLGDDGKTRKQLIKAMADNPVLIERPVVIVGKRAAIGRPPENVLALLR